MKKISILVPCYNEEQSIELMYQRLTALFEHELEEYDYEIIYIDDFSTDGTREHILKLCESNQKVKGVFNARNFGFHRNVFSSFQYASGDVSFLIFGDLQDPPEMLPVFVKKWEEGYKCVVGQRRKSEENTILQCMRRCYYKIISLLSDTDQIELMNGFGLYDRSFMEIMTQIKEVSPYFKAIISEFGINICVVPYNHCSSNRGKSNFNFWKNYDFAMHGITASTKMLMRVATFLGIAIGIFCILFSISVFVNKILHWETYPLGTASVMVGVFFLGAIQLFFIGILGEYILSINERVNERPRTVVEKKINFDDEKNDF